MLSCRLCPSWISSAGSLIRAALRHWGHSWRVSSSLPDEMHRCLLFWFLDGAIDMFVSRLEFWINDVGVVELIAQRHPSIAQIVHPAKEFKFPRSWAQSFQQWIHLIRLSGRLTDFGHHNVTVHKPIQFRITCKGQSRHKGSSKIVIDRLDL